MVNAIKTEDDVKLIYVEIKNINSNDLRTADIALKTNNHDVEINDFTQGILKETIFAIINTLKIDTEIKDIKIEVEER